MKNKSLIDAYLAGELEGDQLLKFEQEMESDADLGERIQIRKLFNEQLEDYLEENLLEGDKKEFDSLLRKYPALQDELDLYKQAIFAIEHKKKILDLRQKMAGIPDEAKRKPPQSFKKWIWIGGMSLAAGIGIFFLLRLLFFVPVAGLDEQIAEYKSPHPIPDSLLIISKEWMASQGGDPVERLLGEGLEAYQNGSYQLAIDKFDQVKRKGRFLDISQFYQGLAYLYSDQVELAQEQLVSVSTGTSNYFLPANWFLALLYIEQEEYAAAEPLLLYLQKREAYKEQATILLELLAKNK
ncbi:MAG: hypothetical protein AAF587_14280 [Bacteroidota bacterium]